MTSEWIATVAAVLLGLPLLVSGWSHARNPGVFRVAVVSQAVVPYRWHIGASVSFTVVELSVGTLAVVQLALGQLSMLAGVLMFIVYGVLSLYVGFVLRTRGSVPCGCFGGSSAMTQRTLGRILGLTAGAALLLVLLQAASP